MKVVIYAAKSTPDERGSIQTQLEDGRAMAEREGWEVVGEYQDEAASAWTGNRGPGLTSAMEHAEREKCGLLVQRSDRLARGDGRDARHLGEIYFWALRAGVELRSVQDDSTFTNPLLAFAMGERNAEDSRRKSLAVKAGMKRRREAGKHNGGVRPYGYRHENGSLTVVKPEAAIVRRIFTQFDAGTAIKQIARRLDAEGVPTARGGRWRSSTVGGILRNPVYVGRIGDVQGEHEPILDLALYDRVTDQLEDSRRDRGGRPPKGRHLFCGGMLRCECGEAMVPRSNDRGWVREIYYCNGRSQFGNCDMPSVKRDEIDAAVFRYFMQVGLDIDATRRQLAEARDAKLAEVGALREQAEREAQRATDRLARVRRHFQDGKLDPDDWAEQRAQLTEENQGAHAEVNRLRDQEREVEGWGEIEDVEAETLRRLSEIRAAIAGEIQDAEGVEAVRVVLGRTFERFVLHRSTPERAHIELIGEPWIEPIPREQAIERYGRNLRPVLRREPLRDAGNKARKGLPCR